MAGFLIYLPELAGAEYHQRLIDVGLSSLVDDNAPSVAKMDVLDKGPDGKHGLLLRWVNRDPLALARIPDFHVDLENQEWFPAVPDGELPKERYWVGYEKHDPPRPVDLQRTEMLDGTEVTLGDGNQWVIPSARLLPSRWTIDQESGKDVDRVEEEFEWYFERAGEYLHRLTDQEVLDGRLDLGSDVIKFSLRAIGINYLMVRELADKLKLFKHECMLFLVGASFEMQKMVEVDEERQKKTE